MSSSVLALEHAFIKVSQQTNINYRQRLASVLSFFCDGELKSRMFSQVPYESLQKQFRSNQKVLEREASALQTQLAELVANARMFAASHPIRVARARRVYCIDVRHVMVAEQGAVSASVAAAELEALCGRLTSVRRKLDDVLREEEAHTERCRARLAHLGDEHAASSSQQWTETRLDRIIVDFLLREGCYESANHLARDSNIEVGSAARPSAARPCSTSAHSLDPSHADGAVPAEPGRHPGLHRVAAD
jgi:hypothetical protein